MAFMNIHPISYASSIGLLYLITQLNLLGKPQHTRGKKGEGKKREKRSDGAEKFKMYSRKKSIMQKRKTMV